MLGQLTYYTVVVMQTTQHAILWFKNIFIIYFQLHVPALSALFRNTRLTPEEGPVTSFNKERRRKHKASKWSLSSIECKERDNV